MTPGNTQKRQSAKAYHCRPGLQSRGLRQGVGNARREPVRRAIQKAAEKNHGKAKAKERKKDAVMDFRHLSHSAFEPETRAKCLSKKPLCAEKFPCHGAWIIAFDRDFFVQIAQARKIELRENGGEDIANLRIAREGCFPDHGGWRIDRLGMAGIFESNKGRGL